MTMQDLPKPESAGDGKAAAADEVVEEASEETASSSTSSLAVPEEEPAEIEQTRSSTTDEEANGTPDGGADSSSGGDSNASSRTPSSPSDAASETVFNVNAAEELAELQIEMQKLQEAHKMAIDDLREELGSMVESNTHAKQRVRMNTRHVSCLLPSIDSRLERRGTDCRTREGARGDSHRAANDAITMYIHPTNSWLVCDYSDARCLYDSGEPAREQREAAAQVPV